MATIIRTDGTIVQSVPPANGTVFTLEELKAVVGGYIEALRAPDGRICYLNEDGKRLELPVNVLATHLLREQLQASDVIVGNVILCTLAETGDDEEER